MLIIYITIVLFTLYSLLIIYYWLGWRSIPLFTGKNDNPQTRVSIIIPARNEENNIERVLLALRSQSYSKYLFETIVIDDHSTDQTASIVKEFTDVKLITLTADGINSYKKKAIETGIAAATGDLIITTDADCEPGPDWIATIVAFKEMNNAVLLTAPVVIDCNSSLVQVFQAMDFMVLQGITGASVHKRKHSMCNGANLAYERKAFNEVSGFTGIDHIASGDDMLLMYKIEKQNPGKVFYVKSKEAIVHTQPALNWREFFSQRIRWASKARAYNDKRILPVLLLVYLVNLSFIALIIASVIHPLLWKYFFYFWLAKTLVELPLFISVAEFFNKRWAIPYFLFFQPLHIIYTIVSGFFGQMGSYRWKGRTVK
jgi:poly-beta-1,6-N-acetyl-D-glucosamine synthase